MRNRGRKNYLKPVRHDILLIELMYHIFSFIAPITCILVNKKPVNLPIVINFCDILAVLLTSKNWHNLFKNYIIILSKTDRKTDFYTGYKSSVTVLGQIAKLIDHKNKPWYKNVAHYDCYETVFVLNQRVIGYYPRILISQNQKFAICFNLDNFCIQVSYTKNYKVFYYPITRTKFKYILHAVCVNGSIKTVLFVTYDLSVDHPDYEIINHVFNLYKYD